jgi:hypothetical protein
MPATRRWAIRSTWACSARRRRAGSSRRGHARTVPTSRTVRVSPPCPSFRQRQGGSHLFCFHRHGERIAQQQAPSAGPGATEGARLRFSCPKALSTTRACRSRAARSCMLPTVPGTRRSCPTHRAQRCRLRRAASVRPVHLVVIIERCRTHATRARPPGCPKRRGPSGRPASGATARCAGWRSCRRCDGKPGVDAGVAGRRSGPGRDGSRSGAYPLEPLPGLRHDCAEACRWTSIAREA